MGTLWNVDNTGNLTQGTIYTRDGSTIRQNVLPMIRTTSNAISGVLNTEYYIFSNTPWTFTMPGGAVQGDTLKITTDFSGGTIQIPALQLVTGANRATTVAGTMTTTDNPASIELQANINSGATEWVVTNVTGNWLCTGSPTNFYINGIFGSIPELHVTGATQMDGSLTVSNNANLEFLSLFLQPNGATGTATMSGGTATVLNTGINANSFPMAISIDNGVIGALRISSKTVGAGFTIDSSVGTDAGQIFWFIINQV